MPEITVPGPNTSFERSSSLEISASLHRCMRRASLVPTANNERFDDSSFKDDSSSSCSVKVGPKNFIARRTGTLDSCYDLGELLGEGGFGQVFECTHLQTGAERAVKVLEKSMHRPELNEKVIDEFNLLRSLNHPNLIRPYEMFEDDTHFYIVTDIYRGGDLFSELEEAGCFSEVDAAIVMNTILSCVNYCHQRSLAHCDLKPENILLDGEDLNDLKIIDFGLAQQLEDENKMLTAMEGSYYYVSPQVIEGSYTKKCDVWACGVISYILLSGCAPFDGESHQEIYDAILQGVVDFDFEAWNEISENAKDFIRYLLTYEEEKRPTTEQALQHSWLQEQRKLFLEQSEQRACTQRCLQDLRSFNEDSPYGKLKQAACTAIASQLLSKQEKDEIDEASRNLDHACDGYLDREDLKRGYRENFDLDFSERDLDEMYKRVNISRTGKIDYSEFAVAMMVQNDMMHDKLDAAFRFFDTDGKGYISAEDINSVLELGEEDYNSQEKILRDADQDGDGVITFMEFRTMMLSTKIRQQRRCSIARTPRNASMALGINSSENSNDYMSGSLQPSSHDSNPNQQPSSVLISHSRRLSSDGLVVLSGRRTSVIDNPLEELQEEELSDNYDDISDDEGY